jgi:hypothetical protein
MKMKKGCLIAVSLFMFFMTGYGRCSADEAGGYSLIIAKHSGKCLDVNGASTGDSASIIQHSCHGGDNQLWRIESR